MFNNFSLPELTLPERSLDSLTRLVERLPEAGLTILFGIVLVRIFSWLAQLLLGLVHMPRGLRGILTSLVDILLWTFLIITVLDSLGLGKLALVFSGSIAVLGLALASGAATLAADILAGILLARDRDFSVGDEIVAGENKTDGVIESMDMRRTRIRAKNGQLHVIPNSVIERKEWILIAKKRERDERTARK